MKLTLHRHDEGFCPIYLTERGNQAVNARELHKALGIKTKFAMWFEREVESHGFLENRDFRKISPSQNWENGFSQNWEKVNSGKKGRPTQDFLLRLDSAKHIAMTASTEQGKRTREYFIWCEQVKDAALAYVKHYTEPMLTREIAELTNPAKQKEQNRSVARTIYAGKQGNVAEIKKHNKRVCKTLTGKEPTPYKQAVSMYFHKKFGSAREAMRAKAPELSATAAVCDYMVDKGKTMDQIEQSGILKNLPDVLKKWMMLEGSYQPMQLTRGGL
jgi:phage anti-repressor protein